jgi:hypothetical protein
MSTAITHGEAWLLEMGVRYLLPICGLDRSDEDLHLWLLGGGHGLSRSQLQSTLRRLFDVGDISATIDDVDCPPFNPTDEQLDAALSDCREQYVSTTRWCSSLLGHAFV